MLRPPKKFVAIPFEYHQELVLQIDTLTNQGHGLGRYNDWVILVRFALPLEKVKVKIYRNDKNFSEADLVEVIKPSPFRISPTCKFFFQCGGCQYQNLTYEQQLQYKRQQIEELLWHMVKIKQEVPPVIPSPIQYEYRSKITPHFDKPRQNQIEAIGFLSSFGRRQLVDIPHCDIATSSINQVYQVLREQVHEKKIATKKEQHYLYEKAMGK